MEIKVDRPIFPQGYGIPDHQEGLLPWSYVEERMQQALNYWIVTASPTGKPAVSPVWGVWLDAILYTDGSPDTRRGRNILHNPQVTVHLEDGTHALILEGTGRILTEAPEQHLAEQVSHGYIEKYASMGYSPAPDAWDAGGLFIFSPYKVMAWTKFFEDATRWTLKR